MTKFFFSTAVSMLVTMALVGASCMMLSVSIERMIYFTATVGVMSFTLNALALGLGALYPNFREENPSKIVSGFGGTIHKWATDLRLLANLKEIEEPSLEAFALKDRNIKALGKKITKIRMELDDAA